MSKTSKAPKARTYPFGDLSKDRGRERLFTIGMALGVLLGMAVESTPARITVGLFAVFVVVVRTLAQYRHPDRDATRR